MLNTDDDYVPLAILVNKAQKHLRNLCTRKHYLSNKINGEHTRRSSLDEYSSHAYQKCDEITSEDVASLKKDLFESHIVCEDYDITVLEDLIEIINKQIEEEEKNIKFLFEMAKAMGTTHFQFDRLVHKTQQLNDNLFT